VLVAARLGRGGNGRVVRRGGMHGVSGGTDLSSPRHRLASALPSQPPPLRQPDFPGATGRIAPGKSGTQPADLATSEPLASDRVPAVALGERARTPPNAGPQGSPARISLGCGKAEPPISARPDGVAKLVSEPKRISPRSPRAALEPDHVPLPPRNSRPSRRVRNPLVIVGNAVFTILILVLVVGGSATVLGKSRLETPGPLQEEKIVIIPRAGILEIADQLKREGVVDEHRVVFLAGVLALGARTDLKAGEYLFAKHASVREVIETIVEGKAIQHQLTIPEGLTSEQIVARLLDNEILTGNIKELPREGSLLPDSYNFQRGFTREQMLARMRQAQDRLVRELWERRSPDLPLKSPEQLIVLASVVEKETAKPEERTRIAAVFSNRLRQKMKLQSDPTVIYGIVAGKGSLGRPLSKSDLVQPTAYNTYVIDGLPPGPIATPGRGAIEAAASPARTKELYFVADGTGGHAFAETYEQHQKNVARLRVIEHEQKAESAAPEAQPTAPARPAAASAPRARRSANGGPTRASGTAQ
jgi:UPF0755 protein